MQARREFFPKVRRTVVPRPVVKEETDVLGQSGTVRAAAATLYGPNWRHDLAQDLIEIWDAGPALYRAREEVDALYAEKKIDDDTVKEFLIRKVREDSGFAKRCLLLLCEGRLLRDDLAALYGMLNHASD
jgi:hypothetical protein